MAAVVDVKGVVVPPLIHVIDVHLDSVELSPRAAIPGPHFSPEIVAGPSHASRRLRPDMEGDATRPPA